MMSGSRVEFEIEKNDWSAGFYLDKPDSGGRGTDWDYRCHAIAACPSVRPGNCEFPRDYVAIT